MGDIPVMNFIMKCACIRHNATVLAVNTFNSINVDKGTVVPDCFNRSAEIYAVAGFKIDDGTCSKGFYNPPVFFSHTDKVMRLAKGIQL